MKLECMTLILAATAAAAAPVSAQDLPAGVAERGTLRIANTPNYPPLEFKDPETNTLTGFDIDIGEALAAKLGVKASWEETSFSAMLSSLETGRVDMILSGMSDLPTRHSAATFVDYLRSGPQFFVRAADASAYPDVSTVCGKRVGASRRTSYPDEVQKWSEANCQDNPVVFIGTDGSADARTQLRQGRIDVAVQGNETLPYVFEQEPDTYQIVGEPFTFQLIGMALPQGDEAFLKTVVAALEELIADGTYASIIEKWDLEGSQIEKVTINGGN